MASAIIGGMLDSGFKAANIWVSAPDDNHLQSIRKQFGVSVTTITVTAPSRRTWWFWR